MQEKKKTAFFKSHKILNNLIAIIICLFLVIFLALKGLNIYTHHGKNIVVPNLIGLQENEASELLKSKGLNIEIADSIYDQNALPGSILYQSPNPRNNVKEGRSIYVSIYAKEPQKVAVPDLTDYSTRQALYTLKSKGFSSISIDTIPSEYDDLVIRLEYRGKTLDPNEEIPYGSVLNLVVGGRKNIKSQDEMDSSKVVNKTKIDSSFF